MAENIVASLFGLTPEMYGEQQRRSALREGIDLAKLTPGEAGAAMTYAGARGLSGAIAGAMGIEDPQLQMITQQAQLLRGLNLRDPQSLEAAAIQANQMGNTPLAMKLFDLSDVARTRAQQQETQRQTQLAQLIAQRAYRPGTPEREQMLDVQEREQMADQGTPMPENIAAVAPSYDIRRVAPQLQALGAPGLAQLTAGFAAQKAMRPETLSVKEGETVYSVPTEEGQPYKAIAFGGKKPDSTTNEFKNASALALTAGPEGSLEYKAKFNVELERLTAKAEGRPNINKIGVAASPAGKAVYLDVNNDLQFIYEKDATGKQVRVPFTGSLAQKVEGEKGGEGGAAGTGTVEVVDPQNPTKTIIVSKAEAVAKRLTPARAIEGLTPKMKQQLEADYPKATSSLRSYQSKSALFIKDLENLRDSEGLESITGFVAGRAPGFSGPSRAAVALYDKIVAKGGFQVLQDMRDMSKTGGALGNVSDRENTQLKSAFAAIDRKQNADDVRLALDNLIIELKGSLSRVKDAYDLTYEYRRANVAPSASGVDPNNPLLRN